MDKARGSGGESIPKWQEQFTSCFTRACTIRKFLVQDSKVVIHPGMVAQLERMGQVTEAATAGDEPQPPQNLLPVFTAPKAKAKAAAEKAAAKSSRARWGRR